MRVNSIVAAVVAGSAAVVIVTGAALVAQSSQISAPQAAPQMKMPADMMKMPSDMAAKCQAMMAEREKMMSDMKTADQRLDGLVAKMNTASGMNKTAATAAVVTEMVAQDRAMRAGMMKMHEGMMSHMMEHMAAGKDSMAMCPMMKYKDPISPR